MNRVAENIRISTQQPSGDGRSVVVSPERRFTERQFAEWASQYPKLRVEWIDGKADILSPDNLDHDTIQLWLLTLLNFYIQKNDLGELHGPNFWIRLPRQRQRRVPDIFFVSKARLSIVKQTVVEGAPDLVVEVVSPESQSRDRRKKYQEYEKAGVREYWIIDPLSRTVEWYSLKGKKYVLIEPKEGALHSRVFAGLYLKPAWLWRRPMPNVIGVLRELGLIK